MKRVVTFVLVVLAPSALAQNPTSYCTAGTSTNGCVPSISANVQPNTANTAGCVVTTSGVEGQKQGIVFYGVDNTGFTPAPWGVGSTSFRCVNPPTTRIGLPLNSGGTAGQCDGSYVINWDAFQAANPTALGNPWALGDKIFVQSWFRDPLAVKTSNLSNAVELTLRNPPPPLPRYYSFGSSCAGTPAGTALISQDHNTAADLGDTFTIKLSGAPANVTAVINFDNAGLIWQEVSMPFNVAPLGAPGCMTHVTPVLSYWTSTDANGNASISASIPNDPALDGVRINAQWMILQAGSNPLGVTATNALSFVIRQEVVLRSVIGPNNAKTNGRVPVAMANSLPAGGLTTFRTIPVPVQSPVDVKLKRIRLVGGNSGAGPTAPGSMDLYVWSSLATAISMKTSGDIYTGWVGASHQATPYGTAYFGQPIEERIYNVAGQLPGFSMDANTTYYIGMSVEANGGFAGWGVSDTLAPSCPSDTQVFANGGVLISSLGPQISSGCVAIDLIATSFN
jgi:hypothetical protein